MNKETAATSYLKGILASTDLIDPTYINEGDREPSWDGNIYLYSNKNGKKTGLKKIPVQVKGVEADSHPDRITFRMDLDDMDNYLRHGGIILFVVYISRNEKKKTIYYDNLLPMKIRILKSRYTGKKKIPVECKRFPDDPDKMISVCMSFHAEMQKQSSFALAELKTLDQLEKEGILEGLTFSVVGYGKQTEDIQGLLFEETPYLYALIKGSAIPQPLEIIPMGLHVEEDVNCTVSAGGKVFYTSARRIRCAERVEFCIGKSFKIIGENIGEDKRFSFNYTPAKSLKDALIDTEFMIAFVENSGLQLNNSDLQVEAAQEKWASELPQLRAKLEYCRKVKAVLDTFGLDLEINIQETTDIDVRNTERFYQGIVEGNVVKNLKKDIPLVATIDYYNQKFIIAFVKVDDAGAYHLYDFNSAPIWFAYNDGEEHHPTSRYDIIKPDDYLNLVNVNLERLVESYQELSEHECIYGYANMTLLNLLLAYDKSQDKRTDLLQCAYNLAHWLIDLDLPDGVLSMPIRKINSWQVLKRMGKLTDEDLKEVFQIADDSSQDEVIRTGAYLILENQIAAEAHFERIAKDLKCLLRGFPIFRYWKSKEA